MVFVSAFTVCYGCSGLGFGSFRLCGLRALGFEGFGVWRYLDLFQQFGLLIYELVSGAPSWLQV